MQDYKVELYTGVENTRELIEYAKKGHCLLNMDCIPSLNNIFIAIQNHVVGGSTVLHHLSPLKSGSQSLKWFGISENTPNIVYIRKMSEIALNVKGVPTLELHPNVDKLKKLLKVNSDFEGVMISLAATRSL